MLLRRKDKVTPVYTPLTNSFVFRTPDFSNAIIIRAIYQEYRKKEKKKNKTESEEAREV